MGIPQYSIAADRLTQSIGTAACPVIAQVRREKAFDESGRMITIADPPDAGIEGFVEAGGPMVAG